jgi:AAA+ ATPase superfamily predicted ATPase
MYFDPKVKEKNEDFFDYADVRAELEKALNDKLVPMIVLYGLRRTGKTSLVRVVLNSLKKKYAWIDGRQIETRNDFRDKIYEEAERLKHFKIKALTIKGFGISISQWSEGLVYLNKKRAVLVIDEAQLLKKFGLDNQVAAIYDNYSGIKTILLGSEIGMLKNFLGQNNAKAPLYGRAVLEIHTHRLAKESARRFLAQGAAQIKKKISEKEIDEAIAELDGIIGWLTKYGWNRTQMEQREHKRALCKTIDEGKYVTKEEFKSFAARAEGKYTKILHILKGGAGWEQLKKRTGISDKQLYLMLKRMISYGFVEKREKYYIIADPLLEAAA